MQGVQTGAFVSSVPRLERSTKGELTAVPDGSSTFKRSILPLCSQNCITYVNSQLDDCSADRNHSQLLIDVEGKIEAVPRTSTELNVRSSQISAGPHLILIPFGTGMADALWPKPL